MEIPHSSLIPDIEAGNYPFVDCDVMGPHGLKLFNMELDRCKEFHEQFGHSADSMEFLIQFYKLHLRIMTVERPHREELADLGQKLVYDFFGVPGDFQMTSEIDIDLKPNLDFDLPNYNKDDLDRLSVHIKKRRLIDAITHGGAVYLWKTIHFLGEEEIRSIHPDLFDMYSQFSADAEIMKYTTRFISAEDVEGFKMATMMDSDVNPINGFNCLDFEDGKTQVDAKGRNLPLLIHEQIKGVLETLSLHGVDQSLSAEDLDIVFQVAGNYMEEQYHYFFGPALWSIILEKEDINPQAIPNFLKELYVLNYEQMVDYFNSYLETKAQ